MGFSTNDYVLAAHCNSQDCYVYESILVCYSRIDCLALSQRYYLSCRQNLALRIDLRDHKLVKHCRFSFLICQI